MKLFKQSSSNKPSLCQRLSNVDLAFEDDPAFSNTIYKNCEAKVKKLEDAKEIKDKWSSCGVKRRIEEGGNEDQPIAKRSKTEDSNKVFIFLFPQFSLTLLLTTLLKFCKAFPHQTKRFFSHFC